MEYSNAFIEKDAWLKTLDREALNDALNEMSFDELLAHRDYMIHQTLGNEHLLSEEELQKQTRKLQTMTRDPESLDKKKHKSIRFWRRRR